MRKVCSQRGFLKVEGEEHQRISRGKERIQRRLSNRAAVEGGIGELRFLNCGACQGVEVTYSRAMAEQFVEGKHGLVAGRRRNVVGVGESRSGVFVTARRVFVRIGELREDGGGGPFGYVRATWR